MRQRWVERKGAHEGGGGEVDVGDAVSRRKVPHAHRLVLRGAQQEIACRGTRTQLRHCVTVTCMREYRYQQRQSIVMQ